MASAPTLPLVSVQDYLKTDYEPNCEYLDGVLVSKAVPDYLHSQLQTLLLLLLAAKKNEFGIQALAELHLRVTPTRFRVPDISVLNVRPADKRYPDRDTPPLFTVEIVSVDEPWAMLRGKLGDHLSMGVSTVILADPHNKTVMVADRNTPLRELSPPLLVSIPVPGRGVLQIDFDDLYRQLD